MAISGSWSLVELPTYTLFKHADVENLRFAVGIFDDVCRTFGDILSTSGLDGHIVVSRLFVVFEVTVFEIAVVDSLGFAVEKKQI